MHCYIAGFCCQFVSLQETRSTANRCSWNVAPYLERSKALSFIIGNVFGSINGTLRLKRFKRLLSWMNGLFVVHLIAFSPHLHASAPQSIWRIKFVGVREGVESAQAFAHDFQ